MSEITVIHRERDAFAVLVRDHVIHVDQPYSAGGLDGGPTPVELFVAALAACAAHYGRGYLTRRGLPADGLEVTANFAMSAGEPVRVARVTLELRAPTALPERHVTGLRAAVDRCTVHNSIIDPPRIAVRVATGAGAGTEAA